jgi:hypothetical protein
VTTAAAGRSPERHRSAAPCLNIEDCVPSLVNILMGLRGKAGLQYLDYLGRTVPW